MKFAKELFITSVTSSKNLISYHIHWLVPSNGDMSSVLDRQWSSTIDSLRARIAISFRNNMIVEKLLQPIHRAH